MNIYERENKRIVEEKELFNAVLNSLRENIDRFHRVCSVVKEAAPQTILDVGCSFGLVGALVKLNYGEVKEIHGIDWSETACEVAVTRMGYDAIYFMDAEARHPEIGEFDMVLCLELLEHVRDPKTIVENVYQWTRKNALFSVPVQEGDVDGEFHVRKISGTELEALVLGAGFSIVWAACQDSEFDVSGTWKGWEFILAEKGHA